MQLLPDRLKLQLSELDKKLTKLKIFLALDLSVWFVHFKLNVLTLLSDSP